MATKEIDTDIKQLNDTKQKERVQIDFTPEALQRLDELKDKSGATTRTEAIRNALRFYAWFINETTDNSIVKIIEDNEPIAMFKASLIRDAIGQKK